MAIHVTWTLKCIKDPQENMMMGDSFSHGHGGGLSHDRYYFCLLLLRRPISLFRRFVRISRAAIQYPGLKGGTVRTPAVSWG